MEPQAPTPEQPTPTEPMQPMSAPAPMPASQEPMPAQPMATPPATPAPTGTNPGHGMGVAGLVLAFLAPLVGFILSLIAMNKSKKAGMKNGLALAGIIISVINMIVGLIIIVMLFAAGAAVVQKCEELGPGTHTVDGTTYTCS